MRTANLRDTSVFKNLSLWNTPLTRNRYAASIRFFDRFCSIESSSSKRIHQKESIDVGKVENDDDSDEV
jgi:hypothetical protein